MRILQIGLGGFGKNHLRAWTQLGLGKDLYVAEIQKEKAETECAKYNIRPERISADYRAFLPHVDVVDIVTPTDTHGAICVEALQAGKDVFVEKPMTMTLKEARRVVEVAERNKRKIQIGYYYRFHPISQLIKVELSSGRMGKIRYLNGNFFGFKRARTDVGVTHTDGIHFLDLFNWFLDSVPIEVYAVCRDHFGRGLEDFSVVLITYPGGTVAKIESGYIQPGRWKDKVVPGAMTSKEIVVAAEKATAEIDFETETLILYDVHHELKNGVWTAMVGETKQPYLEPCDPVQMVCRELSAFLGSVETRQATIPGPVESGVCLAALIESIYESARTNVPVRIRIP